MIKIKIADKTQSFHEENFEWIKSEINKNRVMGKQNCIEVDISTENVKLTLFAHCGENNEVKPSNDIESRIVYLWHELVLSKPDIDTFALFDFHKRTKRWIAFVPK
ncbi:MAG: hypothetical protein WD317_05480 [Balneolaceae bacterium]